MSSLADSRYLKMNGLGNEILVVDLRGSDAALDPREVRDVASRAETSFDQMMVIRDAVSGGADAALEILNTDGSHAQACGNGARCVAWAMMDDPVMRRPHGASLALETAGGRIVAMREGDRLFTVDMGEPKLGWRDIPLSEKFDDTRRIELQIGPIDAPALHSPSAVGMGNPHAIFWVDDPGAYDLARIGPMLEHHPIFPERANISLAHVAARDHIVLRVWERGAGLTRACGSAACAALVAACRKGLTGRAATVTLPGGDLVIEWREADGHVLMTGPVELEHEGVLHPGAGAVASAR